MNFPGHELRARRLELGLSTDRASADCAIPIAMIDALEDGAIDSLPVECYTVGFIRSYCRLLGLEPECYVGALRLALYGETHADPPKASVLSRLARRFTPDRFQRATAADLQAWCLILAAMLLSWAAYTAIFNPRAVHDAPQAEASTVVLRLPESLDSRQANH